jgi:hypothetical protein
MMNDTIGQQAEDFKQKALNTLTRNKKIVHPVRQSIEEQARRNPNVMDEALRQATN